MDSSKISTCESITHNEQKQSVRDQGTRALLLRPTRADRDFLEVGAVGRRRRPRTDTTEAHSTTKG